jgi:hypothetical protein
MKSIQWIRLALLFVLVSATQVPMAQAEQVSFNKLLAWIQDDEPKADIINWIATNKLNFTPTNAQMDQLRKKWADIKEMEWPADLEQCIKDNLPPAPPVPPPPPPPPPKATLIISCGDIPCDVQINGSGVGQAKPNEPLEKSDLLTGIATVAAQAPGYRKQKKDITLIAGKQQVYFDLDPITGGIEITCEPVACSMSLDGGNKGTVKQQSIQNLKPGVHIVEARAEEYESVKKEVTIEADKFVSVVLKMERIYKGPPVKEVVDGVFRYINGSPAFDASSINYTVATDSGITQQVKGSTTVDWKGNLTKELTETVNSFPELFNIFDLMNRIRKMKETGSVQMGSLSDKDIAKNRTVAETGGDKNIWKMTAEDPNNRYEIVLCEFEGFVPVMATLHQKQGSKETMTVVYPLTGYIQRGNIKIPHVIKFLNSKNTDQELTINFEMNKTVIKSK